MYHPLCANLLKAWDIPHIQPDKRVASSASVEARKIKRSIAKRHLECLCRYEEELLSRVDRDVVDALYNQSGMPVPPLPVPVPVPIEARDKDKEGLRESKPTGIGTSRQHNADHETIQSARSRFHPVREVREQAAANLMMMEMQEIEKWNSDAANWGTATAYCDIPGTTDVNEGERSDSNPADNSYDRLDTEMEWSYADDDEEEEEEECWTQWVEGESSRDEMDQQITTSGTQQDTENNWSECSTCDFLLGLPTMPPSSPNSAKHEPMIGTVCSNGQEEPSENHSHATDDLVMVLNDKRMLSLYLDSIEEGIKEARRNRTERNSDSEKARQYCAGPIWRPRKSRKQNRQKKLEEGRGPGRAENESPLRWFEYEKRHFYNELSGQWELTVERRGRDYGLARASDTETQDRTEEKTKDPSVGNQDWNTDTVPDWAGATGSGWFD